MAKPARPGPGRPPRITGERLQHAILEIEGEVPTMQSLARQLGVGVATLYSHVRGQDELRRLAADTVFDGWTLPEVTPDIHWAAWALAYARDARRMIERYPAVHGSRPLGDGQLRYAERVLARLVSLGMTSSEALHTFYPIALLILGVGAQIEATKEEEANAGLDIWGIFQVVVAAHPSPLPTLRELDRTGIPNLDEAFDELVWFTLNGSALNRGEVLPALTR